MSLDKFEFSKAMTDYMLGFSEGDLSTLFRTCDIDHSGLIDYDEFLRAIRGPMNASRQQITERCFAKLDRDGNGFINVQDLEGVYNGSKHPEVIAGRKTEEQVL